MPISPDEFKNTLRQFPSGVTIVTVKSGDQVHGLTASAFVSVSADPPLIAVIIDHRGRAHELFEHPDAVFAVNILSESQEELSNRFAWSQEDRFAGGNWTTAITGAPVLEDAIAWLDCTVYSRQSAGTHSIYIGEVQANYSTDSDEKPLLYWNRSYHALTNTQELVK